MIFLFFFNNCKHAFKFYGASIMVT